MWGAIPLRVRVRICADRLAWWRHAYRTSGLPQCRLCQRREPISQATAMSQDEDTRFWLTSSKLVQVRSTIDRIAAGVASWFSRKFTNLAALLLASNSVQCAVRAPHVRYRVRGADDVDFINSAPCHAALYWVADAVRAGTRGMSPRVPEG